MKKIILFLLSAFSIMIFSDTADIFYKRIQVTGTSTEIITPDTASLTFTISTDNEVLDKASEENAALLDRYKSLLSKSGIKYEKIESVIYDSNKNEYWDSVLTNKGEKEFTTTLSVEISIKDQNKLRDLVNVLSSENINYFSKTDNEPGVYRFSIKENAVDNKTSYQKALNRYKTIENSVLKTGLVNEIKISSYDNNEVSKEKYENVKKEKYIVTHTITLKTRDMKNLGKIINLAQALNMYSNSYISYDIDNKEQLESKLYEKAYLEAKKKADKILSQTDLTLLKPLVVTDNSRYSIQSYSEYFSSYNSLARPREEVQKSSDKEILDLVTTSNLVINPKKQTVTKTVNIEFQIEKK